MPKGIRTPDPRLRRPLLYPAELWTHISYILHWNFPMQKRVMGIEPTYLAWKASVLPLNYTRIRVGVTGFEPATSWSQIKRSSQAEPHPVVVFVFLVSQQRKSNYTSHVLFCQHFFLIFSIFFINFFYQFMKAFFPILAAFLLACLTLGTPIIQEFLFITHIPHYFFTAHL